MPFLNSVRSTYGSQGRFGKTPFVNNFVNLTFSSYGNSSDSFSISGNGTSTVSAYKSSSGTGPWDSGTWTPTGYSAPFTIEFTKTASPTDDQTGYAMIGLMPNNKLNEFIGNSNSYTGGYSFYPFATSDSGSIYESLDTQSFGTVSNYNSAYNPWVSGSTKFYISVSTNGTLKYFTSNRTSEVRTTTFNPGRTFHIYSSNYSSHPNGGFLNMRLNQGAVYNPSTGLYESGS